MNSLVSLLVEYIVMLGRPWFLRNVGGAAIEHPGDRQRTRDNLGKSSFSSIQTERFLAAILQIAIMFLLGVCGTHEHIVSLNISVASVLGDPLYLKIFVAGMTLYRCSFKAPISLAQRYLCKAGHNIAAALLPIVTTGLSMSSLPWSLVLAAPRRMRGAVVYQVIHTLWFPPPERRHHSQIVSPPIVQSNTQEPIFAAPLVSLPPLFLALARVKPTSREFPPMLELFLRSKEHKLLARLEKSTAVCVADVLDEVRNHRTAASFKARADFHVVFTRASAFLSPRTLEAHPPPPAVTLRVVGGIANILHVSRRSGVFGRTSILPFTFCRSVQGNVGWRDGRREGSYNLSVRQSQQVEQSRHRIPVFFTPDVSD